MKALLAAITLVRKVRPASDERAERRLAAPKASSEPPKRLTERFDVVKTNVNGFEVYRVSPPGSDHSATVIFLHGGAYVAEIEKEHWDLVAQVAAEVGVDVCVPIYGLAPGRISYHEEPGALHVYPLLPVPEGRVARKDMVAHIKLALAKV